MEVVLIIYRIISIITLIYGAYYVVMGMLGLILEKKIKEVLKDSKKENNFAIIVPARNEEKVIGNLIDSLNKLNYNKEKYTTYVIVNNTTDDTKKVALNHGAKVIDCDIPVKTKAEVLSYAFDKLKSNKKIDAYVIFDADNVVHSDFLYHMNKALNNGFRVASSFRDAKNPSDSWLSSSYTVFYYIQNLFFCRSRMGFKANATITGTGFMIKKEIIDEEGFNTYTLTEDMEFTGQCALKNERILYVEDAITYDEYPVKFETSWKQRKRWSVGNLQCMKIYTLTLLKNFFKKGKIPMIDMAFNFCGIMAQVLVYVNLGIFRIANFIAGNHLIEQDYLSWVFGLLVQIGLPLISVVLLGKKLKPYWKGIIFFPLFIFSWLPINFICLFKKDIKWEEIKHERAIKLEEIS